MRVFNDINNLPNFKRSVVTIGSFDGVHAGHISIINQLNELAKDHNTEGVLISFNPHPRIFLEGKSTNLQLINTNHEKVNLLARTGLDNVVFVPFNQAFATQDPSTYIRDFLIRLFDPRIIVIGYDHRFGKDRLGDIEFLKKELSDTDVKIIEIPKQSIKELAISSTRIRDALKLGKISEANDLLKYNYKIGGRVVRGKQIGRSLGYPTANLEMVNNYKLIPPEGVYAVQVKWSSESLNGMLYIGRRPTLNDGQKRSIEVNIFDFKEDIYGDFIELELLEFIRDDRAFGNLEALKTQLGKDEDSVQEYFKRLNISNA